MGPHHPVCSGGSNTPLQGHGEGLEASAFQTRSTTHGCTLAIPPTRASLPSSLLGPLCWRLSPAALPPQPRVLPACLQPCSLQPLGSLPRTHIPLYYFPVLNSPPVLVALGLISRPPTPAVSSLSTPAHLQARQTAPSAQSSLLCGPQPLLDGSSSHLSTQLAGHLRGEGLHGHPRGAAHPSPVARLSSRPEIPPSTMHSWKPRDAPYPALSTKAQRGDAHGQLATPELDLRRLLRLALWS